MGIPKFGFGSSDKDRQTFPFPKRYIIYKGTICRKWAIEVANKNRSYNGLANYGYKGLYRVKHGENEFTNGHNHINGIENFWGLCKVRLAKFRGVHKHTFYLHIKECEFRYNCRNKNLYLTLLKIFRKNPLKLS